LHHLGDGDIRLVHLGHAAFHLCHRVVDELGDFARSVRTPRGQVAHLAGHHGKAAALLTSARRFHGGIQGQYVRLK
jgi:hypothetical protein